MRTVPILQVAEIASSGPPKFEGSRVYYATADIDGVSLLEGTPVTYDQRPSRANLMVDHGDVLFAKMRDTDKVICISGEAESAIFSTGFFNLRPKCEVLDSRYLFWFLRSAIFRNEKDRRCTGATQKALTLSGLKEIHIALPDSLGDQRRIAAILDKADAIRIKRDRLLSLADEVLRASFLDMFGDPRRAEGSTVTLVDVAHIARGRFSPRPRNDPRFYDGDFPFIQTGEIANSDSYMSEFHQTLNHEGIKVSKSFPKGTVFVAIVGATIGATSISRREFWCPDSVIGIVPKSEEYPAEFIEFLLRFWKPVFIDRAPDTARANINLQTLRPVPIPIGMPDDAKRFSGLYRHLHKVKLALNGLGDSLIGSLSQRAFRGEL